MKTTILLVLIAFSFSFNFGEFRVKGKRFLKKPDIIRKEKETPEKEIDLPFHPLEKDQNKEKPKPPEIKEEPKELLPKEKETEKPGMKMDEGERPEEGFRMHHHHHNHPHDNETGKFEKKDFFKKHFKGFDGEPHFHHGFHRNHPNEHFRGFQPKDFKEFRFRHQKREERLEFPSEKLGFRFKEERPSPPRFDDKDEKEIERPHFEKLEENGRRLKWPRHPFDEDKREEEKEMTRPHFGRNRDFGGFGDHRRKKLDGQMEKRTLGRKFEKPDFEHIKKEFNQREGRRIHHQQKNEIK